MKHDIEILEEAREEAERQHCERVSQQHPNGWLPEEVAELLRSERENAYVNGLCNGGGIDVVIFEAEDGTWIAIPNPVTQIPSVRAANKELAKVAIEQLEGVKHTPTPSLADEDEQHTAFQSLMEHTEFEGGEDDLMWNGLDRCAAEKAGCPLPTAESLPLTSKATIVERAKALCRQAPIDDSAAARHVSESP